MAKITKIEENRIEFSDGTVIHCDHYQDCCEHNYADFPSWMTSRATTISIPRAFALRR